MSDQSLAVRPPMALMSVAETMDRARILQASGYCAGIGKLEQAAVKIWKGQELGLPPVASMEGIYFFDGKMTLAATMMGALIQRSGRFDYRVRDWTAQECRIEFFDRGESVGVASFSIEEARAASLLTKDNWRKYPKAQLFSRAMSQGAKAYCPAVFAGPVYTPEELAPESAINPETGEVIEGVYAEYTPEYIPPLITAAQKATLNALLRGKTGPARTAFLERFEARNVGELTAATAQQAIDTLQTEAALVQIAPGVAALTETSPVDGVASPLDVADVPAA